MSKLRIIRPSPALVVSVIALIVALAGTAYAAKRINGGSIIKQSIGGGKVKPNTLTGFQINNAKLGEVPAAKVATHTFWAVVNNPTGGANASLARASTSGITVTESGGAAIVTFPSAVNGCANVAGKNNAGTPTSTPGYSQTNLAPGNPNGIEVRNRDETGALVDGDFNLIVVCP
jgi:hypothetical protein